MEDIVCEIKNVIWGTPLLILIIGTGVYLSIASGWVQIRCFTKAIRFFIRRIKDTSGERQSGITPIQSLCTALAASVGIGNIVGVAGAICLGGPGAVFWMWVCAFIGMAVKYSEASISLRFQIKEGNNLYGGPMYMITQGMGSRWRWFALSYSLMGVLACFGVGNGVQISTVVTASGKMFTYLGFPESKIRNALLGTSLAILSYSVFSGGIKRIGKASVYLVPPAAVSYVILCIAILILKARNIPGALGMILHGAFNPKAATGGMIGTLYLVLKTGCSRGIFSNEAGMGTAAIAHGSSNAEDPAEQGLLGIVEVFLDTMIICTMTAMAILCSGIPIPYGKEEGAALTMEVFRTVLGDWGSIVLCACISCFAFATVIGWGLYGEICFRFLFHGQFSDLFRILQTVTVFLGAMVGGSTIWGVSEIINALMAVPNLIALIALSPEMRRFTDYGRTSVQRS